MYIFILVNNSKKIWNKKLPLGKCGDAVEIELDLVPRCFDLNKCSFYTITTIPDGFPW